MSSIAPYPDLTRESFVAPMRHIFTAKQVSKIERAYFFGKYAHEKDGQKRADGRRYFDHPRAVAWILFDELQILDWKIVAEAILHDMMEDSYIMVEETLELNFKRRVALDVKFVTKSKGMSDEQYFARLMIIDSWRALVLKLADRLHNLRTLSDVDEEKQIRKLAETRQYVYPLFERAIQLAPKRYRGTVARLCAMVAAATEANEARLQIVT